MVENQNLAVHAVTTWASGSAPIRALRANSLATFPQEAFEADVVVHRIFGHRQFIFNRPQAIRRILVENPGNTDLRKLLDTSVFLTQANGSIAGTTYGADEAGAQPTAQSERIKP